MTFCDRSRLRPFLASLKTFIIPSRSTYESLTKKYVVRRSARNTAFSQAQVLHQDIQEYSHSLEPCTLFILFRPFLSRHSDLSNLGIFAPSLSARFISIWLFTTRTKRRVHNEEECWETLCTCIIGQEEYTRWGGVLRMWCKHHVSPCYGCLLSVVDTTVYYIVTFEHTTIRLLQ